MSQSEDKREEMTVRAKLSAKNKLRQWANHLSHGHVGEAFEELTDFGSKIINGQASPEEVRELKEFIAKQAARTWEIMWKENADIHYAIRKAAKELSEREQEES